MASSISDNHAFQQHGQGRQNERPSSAENRNDMGLESSSDDRPLLAESHERETADPPGHAEDEPSPSNSDRLIEAAADGNEDKVEQLLSSVDIDTQDEIGETALHKAARFGHTEVVKTLLKQHPDIKVRDYDGWTSLISACCWEAKERSLPIVELILNYFSNVLKDSSDVAADIEDQKKEYINLASNDGTTALTMACVHSTADVVGELLRQGADVNVQDNDGDTPLILATRYGDVAMVGNILRFKPNVYRVREDDRIALYQAILNNNADERYKIVDKLLEANLLGWVDNDGQTPLHMASSKGYVDVVKELLDEKRIDINAIDWTVNATDWLGKTALHIACEKGYVDVARILFEKGAQSKVSSSKGTHSAWFLYVQFLFSSRAENTSFSPPDGDVNCIINHADSDEKADATGLAHTHEDFQFLAHVMGIHFNHMKEYYYVKLAKDSNTARLKKDLEDTAVNDMEGATALQWAAFHGRYIVVWWLLKNSALDKKAEFDCNKAKNIAIERRDQPHEESRFISFKLTVDILVDPPPVASKLADTNDKVFDPKKLEKAEQHSSYQAVIVDFYQRNGQIDMLRRTRPVHEVIYSETGKNSEENENGRHIKAGGPQDIMLKARSMLANISPEAASKKTFKQDDLSMRWVHLPANSMEWMEDLAQRIYRDKRANEGDWPAMHEQVQRSRYELPTRTSAIRFMKPTCIKESVSKKREEKVDDKGKERRRKKEREKEEDTKKRENTKRDKFERITLYMPYVRFGNCFRDSNQNTSRSNERHQHYKSLMETYQKLMKAYEDTTIHGTRSLDRFYYHSLPETDSRDENQVVTRSLLGIKNGTNVPKESTTWPFLTVDQLWLWVIDEETIITSSTHTPDGFEDPVVERMFYQLRESKLEQTGQPPPSSVADMSRFLVAFCIDFINNMGWADFAPACEAIKPSPPDDADSKSIQSLYADAVNNVAVNEKKLFKRFKEKLIPQRNYGDNDETRSGESIRDATILLDEVKEIIDELMILKTLVTQQQDVWFQLVGTILSERYNARGPAYTLQVIQEMIDSASAVRRSVEKRISTIDASFTREQNDQNSRKIMAFTLVTVIFTPMSFLTSLFALNTTTSRHNADGELEYEAGWVFPIIFGVSTGVVGIFVIYAFFGSVKRGMDMAHGFLHGFLRNLKKMKDAVRKGEKKKEAKGIKEEEKWNENGRVNRRTLRSLRWLLTRGSMNNNQDIEGCKQQPPSGEEGNVVQRRPSEENTTNRG